MTQPENDHTELTDADLLALEEAAKKALADRDYSSLDIIGFGELSVALGAPSGQPTHVAKRSAPMATAQAEYFRDLVYRYVEELRAAGVAVLDTEVRMVPSGDQLVAYVVQPLLEVETLGHSVLAAAEPDPAHPLLAAIADSIKITSNRLSLDAQVTNWAWDGSTPTLIDVGTPMIWDESGRFEFDMKPLATMIPAPLRALVIRDLTKVVRRWQTPNGVATDIVANLYREGLEQWVEPTVEALNQALVEPTGMPPVSAAEAQKYYEDDKATFPRLTAMQRLQRTWCQRVRRMPYEYFIHSSYGSPQTF